MSGWTPALLAGAVLLVAVLVAVALPQLVGHLGAGRGGVAGARARARSAHAELGHHVETLPAAAGEAGDLLARARERWTSAGSGLSAARSAAELRVAERTAREGLDLVARACAVLELPGPAGLELPGPAGAARPDR